MKICFIDAGIFIDKPHLLDPLRELAEVVIYDGIPESVREVVERAADADVIAFGLMQFTNEMLDALPKLSVLQFIGTGVWNFVDVDYAERRGIKVLNIDGYGSNAVAEFAVAASMALTKKIVAADRVFKEDRWEIDGLMGKEIRNSTVGVIGTGSIGSMVAEKFSSLGAEVLACDIFENAFLKEKHNVVYKTIEEVFEESDIITLHMKVTKENEKMIDKRYFDRMKTGAVLINVARAELVDTQALYTALASGQLAGAVIDVYDREPPSEADRRLGKLENVIATPHIAYYTQEASDNSIRMTVSSICGVIMDQAAKRG